MANMVQIIKQAAVEATEASKPTNVLFGTVLSVSPLEINIDQKYALTEEFLILARTVTEYKTEMLLKLETKEACVGETTHTHAIDKRTTVTVKNGLQTGDRVILLRMQGGQKYIVLDKVGE